MKKQKCAVHRSRVVVGGYTCASHGGESLIERNPIFIKFETFAKIANIWVESNMQCFKNFSLLPI
jgi:hypothetical protein